MVREYRGRLPYEWTKEERRKVLWELWCAGKSLRHISEVVGIREDTVAVRVMQMR